MTGPAAGRPAAERGGRCGQSPGSTGGRGLAGPACAGGREVPAVALPPPCVELGTPGRGTGPGVGPEVGVWGQPPPCTRELAAAAVPLCPLRGQRGGPGGTVPAAAGHGQPGLGGKGNFNSGRFRCWSASRSRALGSGTGTVAVPRQPPSAAARVRWVRPCAVARGSPGIPPGTPHPAPRQSLCCPGGAGETLSDSGSRWRSAVCGGVPSLGAGVPAGRSPRGSVRRCPR